MKIYIAPIAGVTDYSYRKILKSYEPDMMFTEMISSNAIVMGNEKTKIEMLKLLPGDAVQLFGKDIKIMLESAKYIQSLGVKHIDINAGCPVRKVVKNGYGSALLNDPKHLEELLKTLKDNLDMDLSLKIRIGYGKYKEPIKIAKIAEKLNLKFLTVHGRTKEQMYSGTANWEVIKQIKEEVSIPIIGNGDIFTAEDAYNKVKESNVDGIMLARGIFGNPWLIRQIKEKFELGEVKTIVTDRDKIEMIKKHFKIALEDKGKRAIVEMRKHICWYIKGMKNSSKIKNEINKLEKLEDIERLLDTLII